ncbi:hypothetical protein [Acidiphilium acidophilum]|uniref:Uncharacterized protein n=1 Tax=Acidiphilium acidophilum TaxID=76588 RepID=A0AAW9DVF6_ACIAO|nr:hypothetical protein [Acidiphilium acidophilum]MDX5932567.1 hypothetical protein [Acidiphilium acidophilum]GBR76130.1 hypothetical protein AA700_0544 [Acidiphilium acidophilum DSM 700]
MALHEKTFSVTGENHRPAISLTGMMGANSFDAHHDDIQSVASLAADPVTAALPLRLTVAGYIAEPPIHR